jgi:hypothetical protein
MITTTTTASSPEARSRPARRISHRLERYVGGIASTSASEMSQESLPGGNAVEGARFDVEASRSSSKGIPDNKAQVAAPEYCMCTKELIGLGHLHGM